MNHSHSALTPADTTPTSPALCWDVFCRVIDNHGDLGVCWRLCADLAQRGHSVRLWVDDASALVWMAPDGCAGVKVHDWPSSADSYADCADVVIEAFGCELPNHVQSKIATHLQPPMAWINLEYLSAEDYVSRCHGLPSPVMQGPAKGCTKLFFYPGFTTATGGLLREPDLMDRQAKFKPEAWLAKLKLPLSKNSRRVSLFCYEPATLAAWIKELTHGKTSTDLLVAPGRPHAAVLKALTDEASHLKWARGESVVLGSLCMHPLPYLTQAEFDHLLWSCHLNMVRGEDSLVRAIWAGKPFVWHVYPQDDDAHLEKLNSFLNWLQAPESLRQFHLAWNGTNNSAWPNLNQSTLETWAQCTQLACKRLLKQTDLTKQLLKKIQVKTKT